MRRWPDGRPRAPRLRRRPAPGALRRRRRRPPGARRPSSPRGSPPRALGDARTSAGRRARGCAARPGIPWTVRVGEPHARVPARGGRPGRRVPRARGDVGLARRARPRTPRRGSGGPPEVLSLFAYTGRRDARLRAGPARSVAHVDASKPAVAWARRNAELSGLADAPIRWLIDDARAFVRRERRRGRRYDGVVLDPPSYGHGDRRLADRGRPAGAARGPRRARRPAAVVRRPQRPHAGLRRRPAGGARPRRTSGSPPTATRSTCGPRSGAVLRARRLGAGRRPDDGESERPGWPDLTITSTKNPRVAAAAALRDRRARDEAGLTLVDGVRELRAGARRRGAGRRGVRRRGRRSTDDGAAVVARARERRGRGHAGRRARCWTGSPTATAPRASWRRSRSRTLALTALRLPADPLVVVLEGVEKPGNLGRGPAERRRRRRRRRDRRRPADGPVQPQRRPGVAGHDLRDPARGRAVEPTCASTCDAAGVRILAARVDGAIPYTDGRPPRRRRDRARQRGARASPTRGPATTSRRSACRCSAWPTASTSRSRPPCCCTRRAASAAALDPTRDDGRAWTRSTSW